MTEEKVDRRVQRTRQLLHDALIALVLEKGYDEITVQDIIDRANIGRSTFYAHYLDKQDLFERGLERLREDLGQNLAESDGAAGAGPALSVANVWTILPALALFRHAGRHHHLFRAMIGGMGIELVVKTIDEALADHAQARLDRLVAERGRPSVPPRVIVPYLVGALMALLKWWLDHDMPYPPERMDEMFRQLTASAVSAIFGNVPEG